MFTSLRYGINGAHLTRLGCSDRVSLLLSKKLSRFFRIRLLVDAVISIFHWNSCPGYRFKCWSGSEFLRVSLCSAHLISTFQHVQHNISISRISSIMESIVKFDECIHVKSPALSMCRSRFLRRKKIPSSNFYCVKHWKLRG